MKGADGEYPKVAIWRSRPVALSKILIHIIPFCTVIFLVWINIYGYWMGTEVPGIEGYNSAKLGAMQFAAKAHEITMLASLSLIIFTFVQHRVVSGRTAFGTFFVGLQYNNVSYLWSKELWGLVSWEWKRPNGKVFVLTIVMATFLAPIVGPSSGVLMVPKINDIPAGGTDFWLNTTRDELWPQEVTGREVHPKCVIDRDDLTCPSSGWKAFADGIFPAYRRVPLPDPLVWVDFPESVPVLGKYGNRLLYLRRTGGTYRATLATGFTGALADSLSLVAMFWDWASKCEPFLPHFRWRESVSWKVPGLKQPTTTVLCNDWNPTEEPEGGISFPIVDHLPSRVWPVPAAESFNLSDSKLLAQTLSSLNSSYPQLRWLPLRRPQLGNHSIGAIVTIPSSPKTDGRILSCTVDAHWVDADYKIIHRPGDYGVWTTETFFDKSPEHLASIVALPRIRLSTRWARYLNPFQPSTNQTVLESLLKNAGIWATEPVSIPPEEFQEVIEVSLAMMVSNGLSNMSPHVDIQGRRSGPRQCVPSWVDPLMPQSQLRGTGALGHGGMLWNMSGVDTAKMTKFTMFVTANGYAYSLNGATSIAAIIVLLIYCLMVVIHTIYVCCHAQSSSSWDSISEVVALAMQSRKTASLGNTGSGISTTEIFRSPVQIRDVGERIGITFDDTRAGTKNIEENKEYG